MKKDRAEARKAARKFLERAMQSGRKTKGFYRLMAVELGCHRNEVSAWLSQNKSKWIQPYLGTALLLVAAIEKVEAQAAQEQERRNKKQKESA